VKKLQEMRAEQYDSLQAIQGWMAYCAGALDVSAMQAAMQKMVDLENAARVAPKDRTPEQKTAVAQGDGTRLIQPQIYYRKANSAIAHFEQCIPRLASHPSGAEVLPDGQHLATVLTDTIGNVIPLRDMMYRQDLKPEYAAAGAAFFNAVKGFLTDFENGKLSDPGNMLAAKEILREKTASSHASGSKAFSYLLRSIGLIDQMLAMNNVLPAIRNEEVKRNTKLQVEAMDALLDVSKTVVFGMAALIQCDINDFPGNLHGHVSRFLKDDGELKSIHSACSDNLKTDMQDTVPEHLLPDALKAVHGQYEDMVTQTRYLARRCEKAASSVPRIRDVVTSLKEYESNAQKVMGLLSRLIDTVPAAPADKALAAEAQEWIRCRLEKRNAGLAGALTEKTGTLALADAQDGVHEDVNDGEPSASAPAHHEAVTVVSGAAGAPAKMKSLDSLIAAAESTKTDANMKAVLARAEQQSAFLSSTAREEARAGASPNTVESYMELAAKEEDALAENRTNIAKKFQRALRRMDGTHPKFAEYNAKLNGTDETIGLNAQIKGHQEASAALRTEGAALRLQRSREVFLDKPTEALFHYLADRGQITRVEAPPKRIERGVVDKHRQPRLDPRTREQIKDYFEEYIVHIGRDGCVVAHLHYKSADAKATEFSELHFKSWPDRFTTQKDLVKKDDDPQAEQAVLHYGLAGVATLERLQSLARNTGRAPQRAVN
jgi:hypothetical protein